MNNPLNRLTAGLLLCLPAVGAWAQTPPRERTVAFTYQTVLRADPTEAGPTDLWIPVPHNSSFQQISDLRVESPVAYRMESGAYGNQWLHLHLAQPLPDSTVVTMRFTARRLEHRQTQLVSRSQAAPLLAEPDMARWLMPDRLVPIDGPVKRWAQAVVDSAQAKTDLARARASYNHVIRTVRYDKSGTGWGRGDIYYACDARRGNCTDFHAVFIGYCRAVGIPARFAIGISLPPDRPSGQISGYHCWAECYLAGIGWVPVDASEAAKNPARRDYFFGAHDEHRIEFTIGRDLRLYPQQPEPLNFFVYPYAERNGQPYPGVSSRFSYQNQPR